MLCAWENKSHKICIEKCENGCARKRMEEYQDNTRESFAKALTESATINYAGALCGPIEDEK